MTPSQLPQHPVTLNPLNVQLLSPICGHVGKWRKYLDHMYHSGMVSMPVWSTACVFLIDSFGWELAGQDSIVKVQARQEGVPMAMKDIFSVNHRMFILRDSYVSMESHLLRLTWCAKECVYTTNKPSDLVPRTKH